MNDERKVAFAQLRHRELNLYASLLVAGGGVASFDERAFNQSFDKGARQGLAIGTPKDFEIQGYTSSREPRVWIQKLQLNPFLFSAELSSGRNFAIEQTRTEILDHGAVMFFNALPQEFHIELRRLRKGSIIEGASIQNPPILVHDCVNYGPCRTSVFRLHVEDAVTDRNVCIKP